MRDVLPVVVVGADENLIVQLIGWHGERSHVGRELEEGGEPIDAEETETGRK